MFKLITKGCLGAILFVSGFHIHDAAHAQSNARNEIASFTYFQEQEILRSSNPLISINLHEVRLEEALIEIAKKAKAGIYFDTMLLPEGFVTLDQ